MLRLKTLRSAFSALMFALALVGLLLLDGRPGTTLAGTVQYDVDNTGDSGSPAFSACTAAPNDCSLRGAITKANSTAGAAQDLIYFDLVAAFPIISPSSQLPDITQPVQINGSTGGSTRVLLSGLFAGGNSDGLRVNSSNVILNGLGVDGFDGEGVEVFGSITSVILFDMQVANNTGDGVFVNNGPDNVSVSISVIGGNGGQGVHFFGGASTGNSVRSSFIGVGLGGQEIGNAGHGIEVEGVGGTTIGGTDSDDRNVIANNGGAGVSVKSAVNTSIRGNYIGTNAAGNVAEGNDGSGIEVAGSDNTSIGGTAGLTPETSCTGDCNLISGNGIGSGHGIGIFNSTDTDILGNTIGTNLIGNVAIPNSSAGVSISSALRSSIGDDLGDHRNLISGNAAAGVRISGTNSTENTVAGNIIGADRAGDSPLPNGGSGVFVAAPDNVVSRNLISGNLGYGVTVSNDAIGSASADIAVPAGAVLVEADRNRIQGNVIGLKLEQDGALPNALGGISIRDSDDTLVGGTTNQQANAVAGNEGPGVSITDESQGTQVLGNRIGINFFGSGDAFPNDGDGILISDSSDTTIGGPGPARNIISGNDGAGVHITGETSSDNEVFGNMIGTTPSGATAIPNGGSGVEVEDASGTMIGGANNLRNLISGNVHGVRVRGETAAGTVIQGNFIGTDSNGDVALGNNQRGIVLDNGVPGAVIGGDGAGEGNLVSGNNVGITLDDDVVDTTVQGNQIGTNFAGDSPLGNIEAGIEVHQGSESKIGGPGDAANVIAFNGTNGVEVDSQAVRNDIHGNAIHSNGGLGIDLQASGDAQADITPNDAGDADEGGNDLQNFPLLDAVISGGGETSFQGSLDSRPSRQYRIDFFVNEDCDDSGHGEGQVFLGSINLTTNAAGHADFLAVADSGFSAGVQATVTATDLTARNTSEFSACESVVQGTPVTPSPTPPGQTPTPTPTVTQAATETPTPTQATTPTPTSTGGGDQQLWGDLDCNGQISSRDNQALLRSVLNQPPLSQTEPCPSLGATISADGTPRTWGDLDCNGQISSRDNQALLRAVLNQPPLSQTQPCPFLAEIVLLT